MTIGVLYRALVGAARAQGAELDDVFASAGLSEARLLDPETRLAPEAGRAFARRVIERVGDPLIGLSAARLLRFDDLDLLGHVAQHAPAVSDLLGAFTAHARLVGDTASVRCEERGCHLVVHVGRTQGRLLLPEMSDFAAAAVARLIFERSGGRARLLCVHLPRPRPVSSRPYREHFGAPVEFGADGVALVYPRALLDLRFTGGDPVLTALLRRQAESEQAALLPDAGLCERVVACLERRVSDPGCGLAEVASTLGVSERTVRRHLTEAGTSFRALMADTRRRRALSLAAEGGHTVPEMAAAVGFRDPTAFARAFKRWTGVYPSAFRRSGGLQVVGDVTPVLDDA